MTSKDADFYLRQIRSAVSLALAHVDGFDESAFLADVKTQQAVVLNLLVIGEAASKLLDDHPEVASRLADVPWRNMKGMRNRIAHGYFDIDLAVMWRTLRDALPALRAALETEHPEP